MTPRGLFWAIVVVLLAFAIAIVIFPAKGEIFFYGTYYNDYNVSVLPNNSYVTQGANISQGYCYNLWGVYGFSGEFAHWNNYGNEGFGQPDVVVSLSDLTHSRYENTCIKPETFPKGRWYQWDGGVCDEEKGTCTSGFGHGNAYAFAVVPSTQTIKQIRNATMVYHSNITILSGNETIIIPVTAVQTIRVAETLEPLPNATTIVITAAPTPSPEITDIAIVTPRSPSWVGISLVATSIAMIFFALKRREE